MIIWLTGESGSGKTTLAKILVKEINGIILDGDEMRNSISLNTGFSREERTEHNYKIARLARELSKQINIIISVIAPIAEVREKIIKICNPIWIYVKRNLPEREGYFYEESIDYFTVNSDINSPKENCQKIINKFFNKKKYSLFIGRWQPLHDGHIALINEARKEGKNILIGIRNTNIEENNPYSVQERINIIKQKIPDAEIIIIPDIEEIIYGRKVGYGIREIKLDENTESISATKIRNNEKDN